jgi:hypothetical protein
MSRKLTSAFLEDAVGLLVQYYGANRVRAALAKLPNGAVAASDEQAPRLSSRHNQNSTPSVASTLEQIRQTDKPKHRLLSDFYRRLKDKEVLRESQDIRHYAHLIGLKEISGKSRKDLIPRLMRFLVAQSTERLQIDLQRAESVSEQQRQQGFSVLTDKLLGEN